MPVRQSEVTGARAEAGLTLVEILVSLLLLSIALLAMAAAFPKSRNAVYLGGALTKAVSLGEQYLESMRSSQYTATVDQITAANFPSQGYGSITNYANFRRTVQIQDGVPQAACTPAPGTPCSKTVTVTVFYKDEAGVERSVSLATVFIR
ncbi:MAG: prepilin-type N-terminal cleavage/methylation domain-containing protein [Candidatus Rokubacteria bacterium]|nr:prepilin-type N-terminal cleavage/methylation domain-containing protein [Candidatus Rokubacteria bacterium]